MVNLFQLGDFTLNSGAKSKWKLELDALTDDDWAALAAMVAQMVGPFSSVEGVPRGGLKLAKALETYIDRGLSFVPSGHLIVDDVLTTGGSMNRRYAEVANGAGCDACGAEVKGAVIFARGQCPYWVLPVFQMPECFWPKPMQRSG